MQSFNPAAAANVMCRNTISIGWDGRLYDCDFNQMLELGVEPSAPQHVRDFDRAALERAIGRARPPLLRLHRRRGLELRRRDDLEATGLSVPRVEVRKTAQNAASRDEACGSRRITG